MMDWKKIAANRLKELHQLRREIGVVREVLADRAVEVMKFELPLHRLGATVVRAHSKRGSQDTRPARLQ